MLLVVVFARARKGCENLPQILLPTTDKENYLIFKRKNITEIEEKIYSHTQKGTLYLTVSLL